MAVLGKDLFDLKRSRTNTKIEFGSEGYWVESNCEQQPYGSVLTEILNLDAEPYQQLLNNLEHVIMAEDYATAPRTFMDAVGGFGALPLYRSYMEDLRFFGKMQVEDFVVGEAREAFAESVIQNDNRLCSFMQQTIDEIRFIQRRYGWFLNRMSEGKEFEKKKGQRKIAPAEQIVERMLDAFVSGVSLGEDTNVDAPTVRSQYMVRVEEGATPELVEKMYFARLLDFVYVEFMRALQKGFYPKRCANCGRWFLQTPGATFSYCNEVVEGTDGKTCRDIGATSNFRDKVRNSEIWQLHQRAYKKYFARTKKNTMSRSEFEQWSREAEKLRDVALKEYEAASSAEQRTEIIQRLKKELNRS